MNELTFELLPLLLPDPTQTLFLRACLLAGDSAGDAWKNWQTRIGDAKVFFVRDLTGAKRLLPLLYFNLRANRIPVHYEWLKAASVREELRTATFWQVCGKIFSTFKSRNLPFILGKGAAADAFAYPQRGLRHSHDLDLIVRDVGIAANALAKANSKRLSAFQFQDGSGLPITLHSRLFDQPYHDATLANIWERSRERDLFNLQVHVLSPEDLLLQILGHASNGPGRASGQWVCDAWFVLKRQGIDWDSFVERVRIFQLGLPVSAMLNYLAGELGAEIPAKVRDSIGQIARQSDALALEVLLQNIRTGPRGSRRNMWRHARGWKSKFVLMRWLAQTTRGH